MTVDPKRLRPAARALGILVASTTAGYLTSSFLGGAILRLLPIGAVLTLSTGATAAALLGMALSPAWPDLVALSLLAGLGGGAIDAGLNGYGARHFSGTGCTPPSGSARHSGR